MKWWLLRIHDRIGTALIGNKITRSFIDKLTDFYEWCEEHQWAGNAIKAACIIYFMFYILLDIVHRDFFALFCNICGIILCLLPWDHRRPPDDNDEPTEPDMPTGDSADRWLRSRRLTHV